jgi:hypothetical protein
MKPLSAITKGQLEDFMDEISQFCEGYGSGATDEAGVRAALRKLLEEEK